MAEIDTSISPKRSIYVSFVVAKSRVAPLRPMTIPRLKLQAAVLGSRMSETIIKHHEIKFDAIHFGRTPPRYYAGFVQKPEWAKSHFFEFFLTHCDLVCVL